MPRISLKQLTNTLGGLLVVADPGGTSLRLVATVVVFTLLAVV